MITEQGVVLTQFIGLHSDEELIRLRRRAQLAGYQALASALSDEIAQRDKSAKALTELNLYGSPNSTRRTAD
jgi:hypothetical protein